jgi:hypothetical protein
MADLPYLECDPNGKAPQLKVCQQGLENAVKQLGDKTKVGYPTWEIKGKYFSGKQLLLDLARLSGYKGPQTFRAVKP